MQRLSHNAVIVVGAAVLLPLLLGSACFAQSLASPPFFKTSFDCAKANALSVEEAVCKNADLAKLDVEMAEAYRKRANGAEKEQIVASQRRWLVIRNACRVNPYDLESLGELADLIALYKERIVALKSSDPALLQAALPKEYDWLRAIAPEGFSKDEFAIGRGYASCEDPCRKKPSLYRWISIGGRGLGDEPGDIDTPYAELLKRLAAQGWTKCKEVTDDSGKQRVDRFNKKEKMLSVGRSYSMGVGNGINLAITTSAPLPEIAPQPVPNPTVTITDDWDSFSSEEVGLKIRFPPDWHVYDRSPPNAGTQYKYLIFGADDYKPGDFRVTVEPVRQVLVDPNYVPPPDAPKCSSSRYRISGFAAKECLFEDELYTQGTCTRYLQSIMISTGKYDLTFEPSSQASYPDDSGHYKLTDLYEKILSTIEIKQPN